MAERMRRHSRRAKHLMRVLRRSKHGSVQDTAVQDLMQEIDRRHGFWRLGRRKASTVRPGATGRWRPMTAKAKQLLSQLRKTKVWRLQKQLVRELQKELQNGRRRIDRIREHARKHGRKLGQRIKRGWRWARPRLAEAGRGARARSRRWQEPMIRRAERKQAAREQRARKPKALPVRTPQAARPAIPHYQPQRAPVPRQRRTRPRRPLTRTR